MCASESVVDVHAALAGKVCQSLCEVSAVLGLTGVETHVFDQHAGAGFHVGDLCLGVVADNVGSKYHLAVQILVQTVCNRLQGKLLDVVLQSLFLQLCSRCRLLCLGQFGNLCQLLLVQLEVRGEDCVRLAHVRAKNHLCALRHQIFDGRKSLHDPFVGGDDTVLERNIEVAANENPFAGNVNILNGFLVVGHFLYPPFKIFAMPICRPAATETEKSPDLIGNRKNYTTIRKDYQVQFVKKISFCYIFPLPGAIIFRNPENFKKFKVSSHIFRDIVL